MNNIFHMSFILENTEITLYFTHDMYIKHNTLPSLPHMHSIHEMFILLNGNLCFEGNFKDINITKNDICIIPPQTLHATIVPPEMHTSSISVFFSYKKADVTSYSFNLYEYISCLSMKNCEPIILNGNHLMISNLVDTINEMQNNIFSDLQKAKTTHTLSLLFISLCENFIKFDIKTESLYEKPIDYYINALYLDTIVSKYSSPEYMFYINLRELENIFFLSTRQIQNIFKSEYNMTMKKYNNIMKMEFAAFALRHLPRISISSVALICNYSSPETFCLMFKKYFNISPLKYKAAHRSIDLSHSIFNNTKNILSFNNF